MKKIILVMLLAFSVNASARDEGMTLDQLQFSTSAEFCSMKFNVSQHSKFVYRIYVACDGGTTSQFDLKYQAYEADEVLAGVGKAMKTAGKKLVACNTFGSPGALDMVCQYSM